MFGGGRLVSFSHLNKISAILGQSVACSCMHKSTIWIHLETWWGGYAWCNDESTISKGFPSSHKSQTWKNDSIILEYKQGDVHQIKTNDNIFYLHVQSNLGKDFQHDSGCFSCH